MESLHRCNVKFLEKSVGELNADEIFFVFLLCVLDFILSVLVKRSWLQRASPEWITLCWEKMWNLYSLCYCWGISYLPVFLDIPASNVHRDRRLIGAQSRPDVFDGSHGVGTERCRRQSAKPSRRRSLARDAVGHVDNATARCRAAAASAAAATTG